MNDYELYKQKLDELLVIPEDYTLEVSKIGKGMEKFCNSSTIKDYLKNYKEYLDLEYLVDDPLGKMVNIKYLYNSSDFIQYLMDNPSNANIPAYYSAAEVFDILASISPSSAKILIGKMSKSSSDFENLFDFYLAGDKNLFVSYLKNHDCDLKSVYNVCFQLSFLMPDISNKEDLQYGDDEPARTNSQKNKLRKSGTAESQIEEMSSRIDFYKDVIKRTVEVDSLDLVNEDSLIELSNDYRKLAAETERSAQDTYFSHFVSPEKLTMKERQVLDEIKSRPEVSDFFSRWDEEYQESLKSKDDDKSPIVPDTVVDTDINEREPENSSAGGRPKEFWFKMSSYSYSEAQVKELMKRDIWPTLNLYLKEMKFPDSINNIDSARKAFGAAIIVYSSTLAGLSTNSSGKYTPSMERTLGSSGSTVEKYLRMLMLWFPKLVQYYYGGKINISVEKLLKRWKATDKPRALVLGYNFPEIRVAVNNISFLLENAFHLGTQFKLMEWPEKRDKVLDQALELVEGYQKGQGEDFSE